MKNASTEAVQPQRGRFFRRLCPGFEYGRDTRCEMEQVTGGWVPAPLLVSLVSIGFSPLLPSSIPLE